MAAVRWDLIMREDLIKREREGLSPRWVLLGQFSKSWETEGPARQKANLMVEVLDSSRLSEGWRN